MTSLHWHSTVSSISVLKEGIRVALDAELCVPYFHHASHVVLYIVSGSLEESVLQSQTMVDSVHKLLDCSLCHQYVMSFSAMISSL